MGAATALTALLAVAAGGMYAMPDAMAQAPDVCHGQASGLFVCIEDQYVVGDTIVISGAVRSINSTLLYAVGIVVADSNGNIVAVSQATPGAYGNFSASVVAGGPSRGIA